MKIKKEWAKAALVALGLREGASITEIRASYLTKTTQTRFQRVILSDEDLENEFIKYYKSYITLLKYHSESEATDDLSYYPQDQIVRFHFNQGLFHLINQNYIKAMQKLQEAYDINDKDILVLLYMGILLLKRKNYYAAEKYFSKAVKVNKQNDEGWFYLGENYLKAGEFRKALNMFETARNLSPSNKEIGFKIKELKEKLPPRFIPKKKLSFFQRIFKKIR